MAMLRLSQFAPPANLDGLVTALRAHPSFVDFCCTTKNLLGKVGVFRVPSRKSFEAYRYKSKLKLSLLKIEWRFQN